MAEQIEKRCAECGAVLLPSRRFCINCQAPIAGLPREPAGQLAEIARQIPSTHRPDHTLVFVPERREARLRRERHRRRLFIASATALILLITASIITWRVQVRRQEEARLKRRETIARRELDQYAKSLELFFADIGRFPTEKEGLGALNRRPPLLPNWRGPYINGDFSVDPWGNDYVYRVFGDGASYELFTYGPEGEAAGKLFLIVRGGATAPPR